MQDGVAGWLQGPASDRDAVSYSWKAAGGGSEGAGFFCFPGSVTSGSRGCGLCGAEYQPDPQCRAGTSSPGWRSRRRSLVSHLACSGSSRHVTTWGPLEVEVPRGRDDRRVYSTRAVAQTVVPAVVSRTRLANCRSPEATRPACSAARCSEHRSCEPSWPSPT